MSQFIDGVVSQNASGSVVGVKTIQRRCVSAFLLGNRKVRLATFFSGVKEGPHGMELSSY